MLPHPFKRLSRRMNQSRLVLGSIAGTRFSLHWSFLVALSVFIICDVRLDRDYPVSLCIAAGLILSVLLHELGHATLARYTGIVPSEISLSAIAGTTIMDRPRTWKHDFLITAGGPAVTLLLIFAFPALHHLFPNPTLSLVTRDLFVMNIGLLVFNMLPIYPMDGGRLMRSLFAGAFGDAWSNVVTSLIAILIVSAAAIISTHIHCFILVAWLMFLLLPNIMLLRWGIWWVMRERTCGVHPWAICPSCMKPALNLPIACQVCGVSSILFDAPCWHCKTDAKIAKCHYCRKSSAMAAWTTAGPAPPGHTLCITPAEPLPLSPFTGA